MDLGFISIMAFNRFNNFNSYYSDNNLYYFFNF